MKVHHYDFIMSDLIMTISKISGHSVLVSEKGLMSTVGRPDTVEREATLVN